MDYGVIIGALLIIQCKYNGSLNSFKNHLFKLASLLPTERVVFISTETSSDSWFFCYNLTATPVFDKNLKNYDYFHPQNYILSIHMSRTMKLFIKNYSRAYNIPP